MDLGQKFHGRFHRAVLTWQLVFPKARDPKERENLAGALFSVGVPPLLPRSVGRTDRLWCAVGGGCECLGSDC